MGDLFGYPSALLEELLNFKKRLFHKKMWTNKKFLENINNGDVETILFVKLNYLVN